jgi:hypothetical protein
VRLLEARQLVGAVRQHGVLVELLAGFERQHRQAHLAPGVVGTPITATSATSGSW